LRLLSLGASLAGGRGNVVNTIVGVMILSIISNLMNLMNISGYNHRLLRLDYYCGGNAGKFEIASA
jgi:predicted ABC-type sugar transport system permease subunit